MPSERAYQFLNTGRGQTQTNREYRRAVRSHAARVSHRGHTTRRHAPTRERNHGEGVIVFSLDSAAHTTHSASRGPPTTPATPANQLNTRSTPNQSDPEVQSPILNTRQITQSQHPPQDYLSGHTLSSVQHLPTYHAPYIPGVMNHYITNLLVPIPEIDGSGATVPLFRAAWLPVVFHDPILFQVVMLFAATHYATFAEPDEMIRVYPELLSLKQSALMALIRSVQNDRAASEVSTAHGCTSRDTLIASAAKMASYEAIFGTKEAFHLHMSTVTRLLRQQGGLDTLGIDGFLARLLSFIDVNSAFLLGTNMYLVEFGVLGGMPHRTPFPGPPGEVGTTNGHHRQMRNTNIVDLEHFMGLISINDQRKEA